MTKFLRDAHATATPAPDHSQIACLHDRFSPLESVAVSMLMTKTITSKTTCLGGAVSGVRKV
ncbi:hypothetical protein, partial [Brevundimonas nasdae]|uniref:hypothetical protein n=1 Tax=Brevundimonas nasdae TaxID=172043 RepID=UPI0028978AA4